MTRLDWRDTNMSVIRDYVMQDGTKKSIISPDYERRYREHMMNAAPQPNWKDDPTYNLRRKRK